MSTIGAPMRILILDDVPSDAALVERELRRAGLELVARCVETEAEFLAALADFKPDIVLSDYSLPSFTGMEALRVVQQHSPNTPLIIVTGTLDEETAAECIKAGAADYVLKERLARLPVAVRGALGRRRLEDDKRRAEDALLESENELRAMFDVASIGIAQADPRTGRWLRVNQRMCAITGYTVEELLRLRVPEITHPDDREADWELFERVVRGEVADYRLEKRYIRKDKSVVWVNVNMTVVRDEGGLPVRTVATIEDITDRKRAARELQKSEERYRLLAENTSDVIWTMGLSGHLSYVSPSIASLCGFSVEEMTGRSFEEWLTPPSAVTVRHAMAEAVAAEREGRRAQARRVEVESLCKDGSTVWCEVSANGVYSSAGELIGVQGVTRDISVRHRAQEALRRSEASYRTLFEGANDAIVIFEPDSETIVDANPVACRIYGYSRNELVGMSLKALTKDVSRGEDAIRRTVESGAFHGFESVHWRVTAGRSVSSSTPR